MFQPNGSSIECGTCPATGTTACSECIVTFVLANDDGPIEYITTPVGRPTTSSDRAIALFERAGMLDDPVVFVSVSEFREAGVSLAPAPGVTTRG